MPTLNESLFDEEVKRAIRIEQFKNGAVQRAISTLRKSDSKYADELASKIRRLGPGGFNVNARLQKRIESAVKAADSVRDAAFIRMSEQISAELGDFGVDEVRSQKFILNSYTGSQIAVPTEAQLEAATFRRPFAGRLLKDWYKDLREADRIRIRNTVSTGFREGLTTDQIVESIVGTRSHAFKDGIVNTTNNQIQTIVRTAINHFANSARQSVFEQNSEIISGLRWTATLDGRTSLICASRDGEVWEVDKGPRPPAHHNALNAGTLITTKNGLIPIEDVKVGDLVLTHKNRWKKVNEVMAKRPDTEVIKLQFSDNTSISLTPDHPVFAVNRGWVHPIECKVGDKMIQNFEKFPNSPNTTSTSSPLIEERILCHSYNMNPDARKPSVSGFITSSTAGVSSSIKLKSNASVEQEINDAYSIDSYLEFKSTINTIKEFYYSFFMKCWFFIKSFGERFLHFISALLIFHWVILSHFFASVCNVVSESNPSRFSFSRPMFFSRGMLNKSINGRISDRLGFPLNRNTIPFAMIRESCPSNSKFSFYHSNTLAFDEMFFSNDFLDLFFGKHATTTHNGPPEGNWYEKTIISIVDDEATDFVYDLSVDEDESYVANGVLVHNCRSIMVAVLKDVDVIGRRPAITDTRTRRQRESDFRAQAEEKVGSGRWSSMTSKQRNQEIFKIRETWQRENIGTVVSKTTFETWLRRQSAEFQDSYLGPKRGALFRRGEISIDRFVNKKGETLTIAELKRANREAWKKAGLSG